MKHRSSASHWFSQKLKDSAWHKCISSLSSICASVNNFEGCKSNDINVIVKCKNIIKWLHLIRHKTYGIFVLIFLSIFWNVTVFFVFVNRLLTEWQTSLMKCILWNEIYSLVIWTWTYSNGVSCPFKFKTNWIIYWTQISWLFD